MATGHMARHLQRSRCAYIPPLFLALFVRLSIHAFEGNHRRNRPHPALESHASCVGCIKGTTLVALANTLDRIHSFPSLLPPLCLLLTNQPQMQEKHEWETVTFRLLFQNGVVSGSAVNLHGVTSKVEGVYSAVSGRVAWTLITPFGDVFARWRGAWNGIHMSCTCAHQKEGRELKACVHHFRA